ncbi:hypothetical protein ACEPPN_017835 [Leptodophora sp. 'Broadleaf-Isolate-01']
MAPLSKLTHSSSLRLQNHAVEYTATHPPDAEQGSISKPVDRSPAIHDHVRPGTIVRRFLSRCSEKLSSTSFGSALGPHIPDRLQDPTMHLINVKTFKLEEFHGDKTPSYAILSHTWGNDCEELTFRDVKGGEIDKPGIGSLKFRGCCRQAETDGHTHAWIDTCCIDKTNLVELSEAINSMFPWYRHASVCYAYLSDVPEVDNPQKDGSKFQTSRWFKRGWTLQELLAPELLKFYNSEWRCLGNKKSMSAVIEKITGVPRQFLLGITELHTASVAQRMSWAAQRDTKRKEDLAYCLLGIFDVAMPMIYGEGGDRAFFRLQEQIMKTTRDDSILAWGLSTEEPCISDSSQITAGRILAAAPSDFANSGQIVSRSTMSLQSLGCSLRVHLSLLSTSTGKTIGLLGCGPEHDIHKVVGIPLAKMTSGSSDEYVRPRGCHSVLRPITASSASPEPVHIKNDSQSKKSTKANKQYWLYDDGFAEVNLDLVDVAPRSCWDKEGALITSTTQSDVAAHRILAQFRHGEEGSRDFVIVLELEEQGTCTEAQCCVMICSRNTSLEKLAGKLQYMTQKASGKRSASNGLLHLHVTLEPDAQQPMFIIRPEAMPHPPDVTIDATVELQKLDLILEFVRILEEKGQNDAEEERWLHAQKRWDEYRHIKSGEDGYKLERMDGWTPLRFAAESGYVEMVGLLLDKGADVAVANKDGWTPLIAALSKGHVDVVRLLLGKGADLEASDQNGWTPLSRAAGDGHAAVVELLLDRGVEIEAKDTCSWTSLHFAAKNGHLDVVELLLDRGARIEAKNADGWTPLHCAASNGHLEVVKLLLDRGAGIEAKETCSWTSFHFAVLNGHLEVVELLLDQGAEIEAKSICSWTPLHYAASNGHLEVVELLLDQEAEIEAKDICSWTPLHYAASNGHLEVVELLLDRGAGIEAKNADGWTPLHRAASNGQLEVVELLLDRGAGIEAKDTCSWTSLHFAALNGHLEVVELLLNQGAEIEAKDICSWTPLHYAASNRHLEVVELLLDRGAEIEAKNADGWTPLHFAASNGHLEVVKLLLDQGAEIKAKNADGWTPLHCAASNGHLEVVKLLKTYLR